MKDAIRSEVRKVISARSMYWLLFTAVALIGLGTLASLTDVANIPDVPLDAHLFQRVVVPQVLTVILLILGIRSFTDEFRNGSIVPTVLSTPDRWKVVTAKLIVVGATAAAISLVAEAVAIGVGWGLLASKGVEITVYTGPLAMQIGLVTGAGVIWAMIGVGVGAAVRHQVAGIVGGLVWLLVGETLAEMFAPEAARFLPGHAASAMVEQAIGGSLLPGSTGAIVLMAWAAAAIAAGVIAMQRRDIA
jgi:ABC-type transport system involved in multi-copper enzyme maturation permease subunit